MNDDSTKRHIVIAEDSRMQARMLTRILEKAGFEVRHGENGKLALELIQARRPDIIISDIEMPEMTGYELCHAVKRDAELRTIPLILLSTLGEPVDIIRGLDAGADNYVTKPYEPSYLLSRVEDLLSTPLIHDEEPDSELSVTLAGQAYQVRSGRQQVLNLLISTFENAVEKNRELIRVNQELAQAKDQLTEWNQQLESLNSRLQDANARMTRDLDAAARVQQSLLPTESVQMDHLQIAWEYIPCDELAGDFLNVLQLDDDHVAMFVVDVSGHGVASSLLSVAIGRMLTPHITETSTLVRQRAGTATHEIISPVDVLQELNRRFPMEEQNGLYFTVIYGVMNTKTGELRYASAGHTPAITAAAGKRPQIRPSEGLAIGWLDEADYDEHVIQLAAGDRVFLYSDGVPEAMDPELNEYGEERMLEVLDHCRETPVETSVEALTNGVREWCSTSGPKDDISILAIEWNP